MSRRPLFRRPPQHKKAMSNNNALCTLQRQIRSGGTAFATPGVVQLEYFGHMAFGITSPQGLTLLLDPWDNDPSGTWGVWFPRHFPRLRVDVVLSTHAHYDHNALHRVYGHMVLDRMVGQWQLGDVRITGVADKHQFRSPGRVNWAGLFYERGLKPVPPNNPPELDNTIFIVETGGLRIVHWGDNRPAPPAHVWDAVGRPDVLFLPVDDSAHILSQEDVDNIVQRLIPRIIIPCHYLVPRISSVVSTLGSAEAWVEKQPSVERPPTPRVVLDIRVRRRDRHIVYFGDRVATKGSAV